MTPGLGMSLKQVPKFYHSGESHVLGPQLIATEKCRDNPLLDLAHNYP